MMHITPKASGYFENMWLWVADHMIEYGYPFPVSSVYSGRFTDGASSDLDLEDANNTMVRRFHYPSLSLSHIDHHRSGHQLMVPE